MKGNSQMIKVIYGEKGTGKTKILVGAANDLAVERKGDVVFIDDSNQLIYDLKHEIRFVNVADYPITGPDEFLGFICGIIAQDYDVEGIFIDGLTYILKQSLDTLEQFFSRLAQISEKFKVDFNISINGKMDTIPAFISEYVV
jgi:AAA+ ATPase superfamily predicted ATPase